MLIGISGLAGSGKDTAANFMVNEHDGVKVSFADPLKRIALDVYQFTKQQLWGPSSERNKADIRYPRTELAEKFLREHDLSALPRNWAERFEAWAPGETATTHFLTPRYALQRLGSEWGRDCYDLTWVEYALRVSSQILKYQCCYDYSTGIKDGLYWKHPRQIVVIPDVRFKNEMKAIRDQGGRLIRMTRGTGLQGAAGAHISEEEQKSIPNSDFDVVIDNDGDDFTLDNLKEHVTWAVSELKKRRLP